MKILGCLAALSLLLSGCGGFSFHSNQFLLAKSVVFSKEVKIPELNWTLNWDNESILLLPTNVKTETWFVAAGDVLVRFDGWQIVEVANVLPGGVQIFLEMESDKMTIRNRSGDIIGSYQCAPWSVLRQETEIALKYIQQCYDTKVEFLNHIYLDEKLMITRLKFTIHPNYPPLVLQANNS